MNANLILKFGFIFILVFALIGCASVPLHAPVMGSLYTGVKAPVTATGLSTYSKMGTATCVSVLGIVAVGDASINKAAKSAGIIKIHHVDFETSSVLGLFATYKVYVYGE